MAPTSADWLVPMHNAKSLRRPQELQVIECGGLI